MATAQEFVARLVRESKELYDSFNERDQARPACRAFLAAIGIAQSLETALEDGIQDEDLDIADLTVRAYDRVWDMLGRKARASSQGQAFVMLLKGSRRVERQFNTEFDIADPATPRAEG